MKRSLAISFVLHCLVLGWAVFLLGAPASFEVADVEALPVTLIPVQDVTQVQQGDDSAELTDQPAPVPTKRPDEVADATNVGNNDIDLDTQENAEASDVEQESAAPPKPSESVQNEVAPEESAPPPVPEPAPQPEPEAAAAPEPEPTPEPEPKPAPAPEAVETPEPAPAPTLEPQVAENEPEAQEPPQELVFPDQAPLPERRPQQQVAEQPPKPDTDTQTTASTTSESSDNFNVDEISALLNRADSQGGGAARSQAEASLGTQTSTSAAQLSQSELDALRGQIQRNWSILAGLDGAEGVRIRIHIRLDPSGAIIGQPEVTATGGSESARNILAGGARRAVLKASPFVNLPPEKYEAWREVIVNFDPSQML